jgi:hypothetical protein
MTTKPLSTSPNLISLYRPIGPAALVAAFLFARRKR